MVNVRQDTESGDEPIFDDLLGVLGAGARGHAAPADRVSARPDPDRPAPPADPAFGGPPPPAVPAPPGAPSRRRFLRFAAVVSGLGNAAGIVAGLTMHPGLAVTIAGMVFAFFVMITVVVVVPAVWSGRDVRRDAARGVLELLLTRR